MHKFEIIVEIITSITRERVIYMACTGEYLLQTQNMRGIWLTMEKYRTQEEAISNMTFVRYNS